MSNFYFDPRPYQPRIIQRRSFHTCPGGDSEYPNSRCRGQMQPRVDTMGYECPSCGRKATEEELYKREGERQKKSPRTVAVKDWRQTGTWHLTI